jgi:Amidases related to nicotinamidase
MSFHPALLLIDIQQGFADPRWGARNQPDAEQNMAALLDFWRRQHWPRYHIRHDSLLPDSPLRPGQPGNDFQPIVAPLPGETVVPKTVNSAFIGTDLDKQLCAAGISRLVIAGLTTNHCVSTTTRMAGNLGYDTVVVADATATFALTGPDGRRHDASLVHDLALANLHGEFATVLPTAQLLMQMRSEL